MVLATSVWDMGQGGGKGAQGVRGSKGARAFYTRCFKVPITILDFRVLITILGFRVPNTSVWGMGQGGEEGMRGK